MGGNIADGRELVLLVFLEGSLVKVDMLEELGCLFVVDAFELSEEALPLGRISDLLVVLNQVLLLVFSNSVEYC
jgi:hypothetical protein